MRKVILTIVVALAIAPAASAATVHRCSTRDHLHFTTQRVSCQVAQSVVHTFRVQTMQAESLGVLVGAFADHGIWTVHQRQETSPRAEDPFLHVVLTSSHGRKVTFDLGA